MKPVAKTSPQRGSLAARPRRTPLRGVARFIVPRLPLALLMALLFFGATTHAQEPPTCPDIVQTALTLTETGCNAVGRDQACYGYIVLDAQPQPGYRDFAFESPGDVIDLVKISSLRLSALNEVAGTWGVALMQVQPQALGSDVTFLLFGDVNIENAVRLLPLEASTALSIHAAPDPTSATLAELPLKGVIVANGRLADGSWLRVRLAEEQNGWLLAEKVTTEGDLAFLNIVDETPDAADLATRYGPMQAFYFESGQQDSPCEAAPNSGVLIQTPEGVARVTLWMDEVIVEMQATVFVQAAAGDALTVNVLEGSATLTANGESQTATAGEQIRVPLDANLSPSAPPSPPQAIPSGTTNALPTALLDRPINDDLPRAGSWFFSWGVEALTCPDGTSVPFENRQSATVLEVLNNGAVLHVLSVRYVRTSSGIYSALYTDTIGTVFRNTLRVLSPTQMAGTAQLTLNTPGGECRLSAPFSLRFGG